MTPEETAATTADGISNIAAKFMTSGDTYRKGAELGFAGLDFYVTGRGGVLGEVDADVVAASFTFLNPEMVRAQWEAGCKVMSPAKAAAAFAECAYAWADSHLSDDLDLVRLAELAGKVVDAANPAGAPVFAGWRAALAVPDEPKHRAIHHLNGLRELRGGLHNGATLASGMSPLEAVVVRTPQMAPIFGWLGDLPDPDTNKDRWQEAEEGTNRAMARAFQCLTDDERRELAALVAATLAATG